MAGNTATPSETKCLPATELKPESNYWIEGFM